MLETAFTGGFIASLGVYSLYSKSNNIGELIFGAAMNKDATGYIFVGTLVLGAIGFCVQWRRFKTIRDNKPVLTASPSNSYQPPVTPSGVSDQSFVSDNASKSSGWTCACGHYNPLEYQFCEECGQQRLNLPESEIMNSDDNVNEGSIDENLCP